MGLEDTGYSIKNHNKVWIDPIDYQKELEKAVVNLADDYLRDEVTDQPGQSMGAYWVQTRG